MAFISFSEKAKTKFSKDVLWRAKRDITLADGKVESGTILRVQYEACIADENGIHMTTLKLLDPRDCTEYGEFAVEYEDFDNIFSRAEDLEPKYLILHTWSSGVMHLGNGCAIGGIVFCILMVISILGMVSLDEYLTVPVFAITMSTFGALSMIAIIGSLVCLAVRAFLAMRISRLVNSKPVKATVS